jgi:Protein of unknown function (DUF3866)
MTSFRTGVVTAVLRERPGLQRLDVRLDGLTAKVFNLMELTGTCRVGDEVVCNTTAVELGLGTGDWHVVHWNLTHRSLEVGVSTSIKQPRERETNLVGSGQIMKMRYTSLQANVATAEEHDPSEQSIVGVPIIICSLHSQMAMVAAAFRYTSQVLGLPERRLAYVMTDGASLPIALSDIVYELRSRELLCATVTTGHSFGGDHEAVTVLSALGIAVRNARADAVVVAMGPGGVGTASRLGTTAIEVAPIVDGARELGATPILSVRASSGDQRSRHLGISHHTVTAMSLCHGAHIPVPNDARGLVATIPVAVTARHRILPVSVADPVEILASFGLSVTSMGRGPGADGAFFRFAAAAGVYAARILATS